MDNLQKEIDATKEQGNIHIQDGRIGITASGDAGWQGGGSHMTYNSISGHTLLIGGYTKLIIAFQFFSKMCATCDNFYKKKKKNPDAHMEELPPDHHCAKNWSESSKAMEPMGIVDCTIKIWNSGKAWLCVFVSDDDSSSHAALKHSYEDKIHLNEPVDSKKKVLVSYLLGYWSQFFFWLILHINKEFMEVIYTNWSIYAIN